MTTRTETGSLWLMLPGKGSGAGAYGRHRGTPRRRACRERPRTGPQTSSRRSTPPGRRAGQAACPPGSGHGPRPRARKDRCGNLRERPSSRRTTLEMRASWRCGAGARASRLHPPTRCLPRLACRRAARPRSRRTGLRGRRLIWPRPAVAGGASPSVSYPGEGAVMIGAVVVLAAATGNDTPCATVAQSRRSDRVFAVIPAVSDRQELFPVREHPPVLRVRERSARLDESERAARLGRKLLEAYFGAA